MLYFLHGLGDNQQSLINMGAWNLISDLRQQNKIGDFLIATPQGGGSFYINSADGRTRYSDFFLDEFLPFIERKYHTRTDRAGRAISGISMGGYGALPLRLRLPAEVFRRECRKRRTLLRLSQSARPGNAGGLSARQAAR